MSISQPVGKECGASGTETNAFTAHPNRETRIGELSISRALPIRDRRMVGPWCFLDRFGPFSFTDETPMKVPPHPHIGLQTVSWLLEGEILHTDSLNSQAILYPGGVNVMTAGGGIAHAEETPAKNSGRLNGVQLWVALLDEHRDMAPSFTTIERVPIIETKGGIIELFAGTLKGITSPAPHFSEILGASFEIHPRQSVSFVLNPQFEHAVMLLEGDCELEKMTLNPKTLYYLGPSRQSLDLGSEKGGKVLLIGGPPFPETILMWWNFIARTPEEIRQAAADWDAERHFGVVEGTHLKRLAAPDLGRFARPNPIS